MVATDPRTLLDLHRAHAAELRAEAAADGLARRVRAAGRHRRPARGGLLRRLGLLRRAGVPA